MAESASHSKKFLKQHRAIQLIEDTKYLLKWCLESYMDTCFEYDIFLVILEDIPRTTISETMCDDNIIKLYNALLKVLKHFSQSPKSTELLNNALTIMEMSPVHMLTWAGTRMGGFLDGCKKFSAILKSFMDTLVTGNIRTEETLFLLSPMGIFLLQLMSDLSPVFVDKYSLTVVTSYSL